MNEAKSWSPPHWRRDTRKGVGREGCSGANGRLGSIAANAGPRITTPEPVLAKMEITSGQEQLDERGETVVAAIGGATHAH